MPLPPSNIAFRRRPLPGSAGPRPRRAVAAACLLAGALSLSPGIHARVSIGDQPPPSLDAQREAAVLDARQGAVQDAYQRLRALLGEHPQALAVRLDLAVVAQWAGDDAHATALLDALDPQTLPDYVLEAYAKAARNLKRWDQALSLYDILLHRLPQSREMALARVLVLADAGRDDEAAAALAAIRASADAAAGADLDFACGYLAERARRFTRALACYQQALEQNPQHADARRRQILTTAALGAPRRALQAARAHPRLLSAADLQRLELDAAAIQVRWAALAPAEHADAALAAQDRLLMAPNLAEPDTPRALSLRFDRIAALAAAGRMSDATAAFEAVEAHLTATFPDATEGVLAAFPVYALAAAADAYLHLQRPERAAVLYEAAVGQAPERLALGLGLFYAYSDLHDYRRANALASRLAADEPAWLRPRPERYLPNPRYADVAEIGALELAFRDRYDEALSRFDAMLADAPAHDSLRLSRAQVRRWRGWPTAAWEDVRQVRHHAPDNLQARALEGQLALDGRSYPEASRALAELTRTAPDAADTLDLAARWRVHNRPEINLHAGAGRSRGGPFAGRDWETEARYFTAPLRHRYRLFFSDRFRFGRFDEGAGRDHRLGVGMEHRRPAALWRAEVTRGIADNDRSGASAEVNWFAGDRLTLDGRLAFNAMEVPLRAIRIGITGDAAGAGARYRWHESREAFASAGGLRMDDGNERRWAQLGISQRILNLPRHKLELSARGYGSRNSETGRAYYNPAADRELTLGLTHEWRVFRRYDRGLTARLGVEAGDYRQRDFGNGAVWSAFVENDWLLGPRARLSYGLRTGGRVYDGQRERQLAAYLSLEWRP